MELIKRMLAVISAMLLSDVYEAESLLPTISRSKNSSNFQSYFAKPHQLHLTKNSRSFGDFEGDFPLFSLKEIDKSAELFPLADFPYNFRKVRHRHNEDSRFPRNTRNLHEPRFTHSEYHRTVDENVQPGTSILTVEATDDDLDEYGLIRYEVEGTNAFAVDEGGVVYTNSRLDYESSGGVYDFYVVANNPSASSDGTSVPIRIQVRDTPDAPVFNSDKYYFNISELATDGDYVGTVVARDSDNDLESYSLQNVSPEDLFEIDEHNGIITVQNRESGTDYVYEFQAVATDATGSTATVPVVVNVIDENTNKPIFDNCSGYNNLKVKENQTVPQDILIITATDADHGKNGYVEYSLLTDDPEFAIDPVSGQLTVQQPLDRDNGLKEHFLTVIAKDMADDPLQSSCSFTIIVTDINDNPPVFDLESYSQTVPSDTEENSPILRLTASDDDAGANAEIVYSLEGSDEDLEYFSVDRDLGYIILQKPLTQSMANEREFIFKARATDVGEPDQEPLTSTVDVVLSVVSPGSMPPTVENQNPELAQVNEDATLNTNIVSICASSNSEDNSVYMDMINGNVPETNSEGTFDIRTGTSEETGCPSNTIGGNIFLATQNLDFEEIQSYTLIIQLANNNGRAEYSLTVDVIDVNDNPPVLQQPYTGSIGENVDSTMVMVVQAVDKDITPEFRQLEYSFKDPPDHVTDNFEIDPVSGEIWNTKPLDRESEKQYRIPVQVSDGVNVRDRQYWIIVNDENDEPPKFNTELGVYETHVDEDMTIGKDTGIKLVVEDKDILNEFSYEIIGGNDANKFKINAETGSIYVNDNLDYDSPVNDRNFTIDVRVADGKSFDTTQVRIIVRNVNDLAPLFNPKMYEAIVRENTECNITVTQVYAYDPDYPTNGSIIYSLSRSEQSNFTIDPIEGTVKVKGCMDREAAPLGMLTIYPIAFDEGGEGKNSEPATVEITIEDENDNHPFIQSPPDQYTQFPENVSPEDMSTSTVVVIRLSDQDDSSMGNGCPCTLAFDESTPPNVFESFDVIENGENDYKLVTTKTLDREAQKYYVIPFRTTDSQGLSGVRELTVEVGDQNDSPMTDGESKITVYNYRGSFNRIIIGSVYVTDADDYDVADKTFKIDTKETATEDISHFQVDPDNGNITMLRLTPAGDYLLVVNVTDNARKEEAKGIVHITVIELPKEAVMESGSFLIQDYSVSEVITQESLDVYEGTSLYDLLKVEFGRIFDELPENVDIFYLQDVERRGFSGVDVRFNIHGSPYYTSSHVNGLLMQHKDEVENNLGIKIPVIDDNLCLYEDFQSCNGTSCQQELRAENNNPLVLESETSTIVGVRVTEKYTCNCGYLDPQPRACPEGFENYCYNGGVCNYTSAGGLSCTCLDDYNYGPRCELLTGRFKNGFAWFDTLGTCEEPTLHITFQSDSSSAVLLYNGPVIASPYEYYPKDFLYIVLNNWVVEAYLNLGSETSRVYVPVDEGESEPYDVYLSWTKSTVSLIIPNCGLNITEEASEACKRTLNLPESATSILNAGGPLQIGGLAPMIPLEEIGDSFEWNLNLPNVEGLSGCISYLEYNGEIYDLNRTTYNKYFYRTCEKTVVTSRMMMSSESVLIIVGSLLVLLLLVLFVLCLLRRRKKPHSYPDHLNDIVKETIGTTDIEGYGEKDMTQFDLKLLRVTPEGKLLNGYGTKGDLPDVAKGHSPKKAPLARLSEGFNVEDFIDDNITKVDKEHPDFDDVRHYCFEGDEMSIASLSSLGSGSYDDDGPYNYKEDWGPRFNRIAEIYGPKPDEEEDSDYEFPIPKKPPKVVSGGSNPSKLNQITPSSGASSVGSLNTQNSADGSEPSTVPYTRLGQHNSSSSHEEDGKKGGAPPVVFRGEYHEAVNPLAQSKESWC
uniref:Le1-cadherin n=1 Tax=Ligia exotica TaxID=142080 RepID=A0A0U5B4M7_9CRUS|nr:Le1-cadherin [Ligia exotica]